MRHYWKSGAVPSHPSPRDARATARTRRLATCQESQTKPWLTPSHSALTAATGRLQEAGRFARRARNGSLLLQRESIVGLCVPCSCAACVRVCVSANRSCNHIIKHHHHHPLSASVFFIFFCLLQLLLRFQLLLRVSEKSPRVTENNNQPIWVKVTVCQTGLESPAAIDRHFFLFVRARVCVFIMLSCNRCCIVAIYDGQRMTPKLPCCEDGIWCTAMIGCAVQPFFFFFLNAPTPSNLPQHVLCCWRSAVPELGPLTFVSRNSPWQNEQ